jgi:proliferating cell nuclear antigen
MNNKEPALTATVRSEILREAVIPASIFEHRSALVEITSEGLEIRATDLTRIGSANIHLSDTAFDSYRLKTNPIEIGLQLDPLPELLSLIENESQVKLILDRGNMSLWLETDELKTMSKLEDPSGVSGMVLNQDYYRSGKVVLSGDDLDPVVGLADMIASRMTIGVDPSRDAFYAVAAGDTDSVQFNCELGGAEQLQTENVESVYPIDYFNRIQQAIPSDATVKMSLGDDVPLKIQYPFANGQGMARFRIQPTI